MAGKKKDIPKKKRGGVIDIPIYHITLYGGDMVWE